MSFRYVLPMSSWLVALVGLFLGLQATPVRADCLPESRPFNAYLLAQRSAWETADVVYVATVSSVLWRADPEDSTYRKPIAVTLKANRVIKGQLDDEGIWGDLDIDAFCVTQRPFSRVQVGSRFVIYSGREGVSPDATVIPLAQLNDPQALMAIRGDDTLNEDSLPWHCAIETIGPCRVTESGPVPGPAGAPQLFFQTMSETLGTLVWERPNELGSVVLEQAEDGRFHILFANIREMISGSDVRMHATPQGPLLVLQATEKGNAHINADLAYLWRGGRWQLIDLDLWQDDVDWNDWGGQTDWFIDWAGLSAIHGIGSRAFEDGCRYEGSVEAMLAVEGDTLKLVSLNPDIRSETGGCPVLPPSRLPAVNTDEGSPVSAQERMAGEQGLEP